MRAENVLKDNENGITDNNGNFIRKGTIYTMLVNASLYNEIISSRVINDDLDKLISDMRINSENVAKSGLFEFFNIQEWLNTNNEGRFITALLYLKQHPEIWNENIRNLIINTKENFSDITNKLIEKLI